MSRAHAAMLAVLLATVAPVGHADAVPQRPPAPEPPAPSGPAPDATRSTITGTVVETMNAGRYTYMQVDTGDEKVWAAGPSTELNVGDVVTFPDGGLMEDFFSGHLGRRFDRIYLVSFIEVKDGEDPSAKPSTRPGDDGDERRIDFSGIERAEGGMTVGEVFEARPRLAGQQVTIRGKVVKFSPRIMGKNWLHLQDGTVGPGGAHDLTVTTSDFAAVGDTVVVRGTVAIDVDLGYGYEYEVLIEDASVTVE